MKTITAGSAGGVKKLKRKIQLENELKERKIAHLETTTMKLKMEDPGRIPNIII